MTLVYILLVYLLLLLIMFLAQRSFIYIRAPVRYNPEIHGINSLRAVQMSPEEGLMIEGWYVPPADPQKPVIVLFHGNASNLAMGAEKGRPLIARGYGYLVAEYRGYSGNPGKPSENALYSDARGWIGWLGTQGMPEEKIVLYGESLGSGVAVQMATEHQNVAAVILEAPYKSLHGLGQEIYWFFPVRLLARDRFESLKKIVNIKAPLLILHGKRDRVVPYVHGMALYEAAMTEKKEIAAFDLGNHLNLYSLGAADRVDWFLSAISKK